MDEEWEGTLKILLKLLGIVGLVYIVYHIIKPEKKKSVVEEWKGKEVSVLKPKKETSIRKKETGKLGNKRLIVKTKAKKKSYSCLRPKCEWKGSSASALGGHMRGHSRRDKKKKSPKKKVTAEKKKIKVKRWKKTRKKKRRKKR